MKDDKCYPCNGLGYHIETCIEYDGTLDRVIQIVQNEPTDSKYWAIKEHPLAQYEAIVDDGNVIRPKDGIVHPD